MMPDYKAYAIQLAAPFDLVRRPAHRSRLLNIFKENHSCHVNRTDAMPGRGGRLDFI
jgi:hypothetical protein